MSSASNYNKHSVAGPSTFVEISVSCRNLRDLDVFSKSDPMCVLFVKESAASPYREYGRTEKMKDALNPDFVHKFIMEYYFEEVQHLKFEIYDVDSKSSNLKDHDFLGKFECTLGEVVAYQGTQFQKNIESNTNKTMTATIILVAEELRSCKNIVTMQFRGEKLDKKDTFGKSDPFLIISKHNSDSSFTVVHKTEVIKHTLNPTWKPFTIKVSSLCNGIYDKPLKIECYDWDKNDTNDLIGEFQTDLKTLLMGPGSENEYELINHRKKSKKAKYINSGIIKLMSFSMEEQPTFLDYIGAGTQLHCTVAIDFTASNGNPRDPESLHYISGTTPNDYVIAIRAICEIIQDYDSDRLFPALGFGARLPDGSVSHDFFLNGHPTNPYCNGIEGILEAYYKTVHSVELYGPTNFAPVINHVANIASAYRDGSQYFILLIITDGIISDMLNTKEAIVNASTLPFSIIIIGVGPDDFSAMEMLDGDDVRLNFMGRYAARDIVQFVAIQEFLTNGNWLNSKKALAKAVLAEVPDQFLSYMKMNGIKPEDLKRPPQLQSSMQRLNL